MNCLLKILNGSSAARRCAVPGKNRAGIGTAAKH
jgi:hypothetical protein